MRTETGGFHISVGISVVDKSELPKEVQEKVGDRPVYDFSIKAGDIHIADFGGGKVIISIAYTPKPDEDEHAILVYYISSTGELKAVRGKYDPELKMTVATVTHLSKYAVGYNKVTFNDVAEDAWYNEAIGFMAARGIVRGVGGGRFLPENNVKRADFLIMVMNSFGIEVDENVTSNFDDAGDTYYTSYLGTAKRLGLILGKGGNRFAPEESISRQDMFVILYRILGLLDELPVEANGSKLENFADADKVADYAQEAIKLFVETGIVKGSGEGLKPRDTSTRAQAAQVLYNLLIL